MPQKKDHEPSIRVPKELLKNYRKFKHQFHWSEDIDYGGSWVMNRAKEIFEHVDAQKSEIFENSSGETSVGLETKPDFEDRDDGISYEMATKLCGDIPSSTTHDETIAAGRCQPDGKWTKLYEQLVNFTPFLKEPTRAHVRPCPDVVGTVPYT